MRGWGDKMQFFISEYGKIMLAVMASFFIVSVVLMSFLMGWQRAGGVSDSEKTNFSTNEERRTSPKLYVKDFKVKSGEKKILQSISQRWTLTGEISRPASRWQKGIWMEDVFRNTKIY